MWADTHLALMQAQQKREELARLYADANRAKRSKSEMPRTGHGRRRTFLRLLPVNR